MAAVRIPVKSRPARVKAEPEPRVHILKDDTLESVAEFINEGKAKNIIVMSGAGISTAAGIKDFRSPGTGLYDDLERFNLPYPEAVFDISFFKPTLTHYLLPLLAKKGLLLRSYTQNIDMLERLTGLDEDLLVEAHGSFATSKCIECHSMTDNAYVRKHILKGDIPHCKSCGGLVKPTITFFGEMLPSRFGDLSQVDFKKCDLLIVLGTSLQVEPFNRLITKVSPSCPRLLINRDKAGEDMHSGFDFDDKWKYTIKRDAVFLGNCDDGVRKLAQLCGWEGELQAMFEAGDIEMQLAEEMEALALAKELGEVEEKKEKEEKEDKSKEKVEDKEASKEEVTIATDYEHSIQYLDAKISAVSHTSATLEEITEILHSTTLAAEGDDAVLSETIVVVQKTRLSETAEGDEAKVKKNDVSESTVNASEKE
ncbi:NAD-dependent protein deacetylase sirtuin-2 [Mortierella sp. GBA30]|nr:NAD-dependent protein deacetylase sirtuin-2 [Mortierella sp. GBA30]